MKFILTTHNITLTDAIEQHVLEQVEKLEHIDRWLIDVRVTLEKDHVAHSPEKQFKCGIRIGVRGNDLFAEDRQSDLYAAIDLSVKKVQQQLRERHSRAKAKKHKLATRLKETRRGATADL
jgi:ribosomal subunit interface protein